VKNNSEGFGIVVNEKNNMQVLAIRHVPLPYGPHTYKDM
jgi:hypothetical protein